MTYLFDTTQERSALMKRIKSIETKAETMLRKALWHNGLRYRKNYSALPGKPDIVITKHKIAVFVDGEFWHGFNWANKKYKIKSNRDYWVNKIEKNIERDIKYNTELEGLGYLVIRFWEKEVNDNLCGCTHVIKDAVNHRRAQK